MEPSTSDGKRSRDTLESETKKKGRKGAKYLRVADDMAELEKLDDNVMDIIMSPGSPAPTQGSLGAAG